MNEWKNITNADASTQVQCMAQHSSWHPIILCVRYKNTEQALFILILDQDTKGKDLSIVERGSLLGYRWQDLQKQRLLNWLFNKKKVTSALRTMQNTSVTRDILL